MKHTKELIQLMMKGKQTIENGSNMKKGKRVSE